MEGPSTDCPGVDVDSNSRCRMDNKGQAARDAQQRIGRHTHPEYVNLILDDGVVGERFHVFLWQAQILYGTRGAALARWFCSVVACEGDQIEHRTRLVQNERSRLEELATV